MADRKQRLTSLFLTLLLGGLNLAALNFLLSGWSTARLDLTQEGLYSISASTKRLLTELDEDLTISGYFSKRTHPKLAPLIPELTDLLAEYPFHHIRVRIEVRVEYRQREVSDFRRTVTGRSRSNIHDN